MPAEARAWLRPDQGDASLYRPDPKVRDEFEPNQLPLKVSAVLMPIVERNNQYSVILTKRAEHLSSHSGQVSFPGGKSDEEDEHAMATALREAKEEINLPYENVDVIGAMEDYETVTGYNVSPVVGFVDPDFKVIPEKNEVDDVFEVPLDFILDPANHKIESLHWKGAERHYYVFPHDKYKIWGATAAMLVRFANLVNDHAKCAA
ncbi:CoA pyrophosphatase [Pseudemcibacter aquimaris]|nr:CoA pyrophosphatase [Pseudemcibacter aquimaris]WDU59989.1 CoA pyrophosphatase [Pseudemcibacter aquimaris]